MPLKKIGPVLVGAFPPPVHGMAAVNAAVLSQLQSLGVAPTVINLAASSLDRSLWIRLGRLPRVVLGLIRFCTATRSRALYMNVSGGFGQVYEIAFLALARARRMRVYLHHHCSSYLDSRSAVTWLLTAIAGAKCTHIVQSPALGKRLRNLYVVKRVVPVSNAVYLMANPNIDIATRTRLKAVGYISNISQEKGIFDYLDLMEAALKLELPLTGSIAGPFQDQRTERAVMSRLRALPAVAYLGPLYGVAKNEFFAQIDVLVFPTRYINETEGIVNHEAMSRGIPVIAYGRGAIPEIVSDDCGKVIDPSGPFLPEAISQIQQWLLKPAEYQAASAEAPHRFSRTHSQSSNQWSQIISELVDARR